MRTTATTGATAFLTREATTDASLAPRAVSWRQVLFRIAAYPTLVVLGLLPHFTGGNLALSIVDVGLFVVAAHLVARWSGLGGLAGLGLARRPGWGMGLALGFFAAMLVVAGVAAVGWQSGLFVESSPRPLAGVALIAWASLLTNAYVGLAEESVHRGYLLRVLPQRLGRPALAIVSGVAFTAAHGFLLLYQDLTPLFWVYLFVVGVAFSIPYLITGAVWVSMGLHWGQNVAYSLIMLGGIYTAAPMHWNTTEGGHLLIAMAVGLGVAGSVLALGLRSAAQRRRRPVRSLPPVPVQAERLAPAPVRRSARLP